VFSKYIDQFDGFSFYGSFSTTVVTMAWLYFCMYAVLLGAQINIFFSPVFNKVEQAANNRKKAQLTNKDTGRRRSSARRRGVIKNK
jgi:membrane protein